jgi:hypothetical protein
VKLVFCHHHPLALLDFLALVLALVVVVALVLVW